MVLLLSKAVESKIYCLFNCCKLEYSICALTKLAMQYPINHTAFVSRNEGRPRLHWKRTVLSTLSNLSRAAISREDRRYALVRYVVFMLVLLVLGFLVKFWFPIGLDYAKVCLESLHSYIARPSNPYPSLLPGNAHIRKYVGEKS